ncbi:Pr6Pr family membrane protein [Glaciihabitans sp. UYNi722]|uniref:Pr6Pr family membrane protein n=1 Tax=Glaciihabitans sp. UYNi722 TaxID=3156344 RepID=UPI003391DEDE
MKLGFAIIRIIVAMVGIAAIIATTVDTASRSTINPFNFFGYFTIQSNILFIVVCLIAAVAGRRQSRGLALARASATTYIVTVGIVYNTLLAGLEGGISLEWANTVLHVALPIYAAIDWVFFGDRTAVPWKRFWIVLIYPLVWLIVVLIRGATDGWVPYPFLNPNLGYGIVALYGVGVAVAIGIVGTAVWAISRVRILKP